MRRPVLTALALTAAALALAVAFSAWPTGTAGQGSNQMVNCPQAGKWSIAVWDGPADTDAETALDTCATTVDAAFALDPDTQLFSRFFRGRPEVSNLQPLGELQGVLALGGSATTAAGAAAETVSAAQSGQMVNCPQTGKWSIAVWDGPADTDAETALDTCATTVDAAFALDPDTQLFSRFFRGRPEVSNLQSLDEHQGVLALGTVAAGAFVPPTFEVDETVTLAAGELPGFEDGVPRPLASIVDEDGWQAVFVADELIISTDDQAELDAFLARWEGEVLLTLDPAEYGLTGISPMYLVRINTSLAEALTLEEELRALSEEDLLNLAASGQQGTGLAAAGEEPDASAVDGDLQHIPALGQGQHRVSSQEGLNLLAAGASEAADSLAIGVNWVGPGADFRNRITKDGPGCSECADCSQCQDYSWNAFDWVFMNARSEDPDTVQDIGVTEAWRLLQAAGRLDNKIKIAILDMGFSRDSDIPADWTAISNVPFTDPIGTENLLSCGGHSCPWHGTNVADAAMGVPDNEYGGAGPAGPVAEPILVFTLYDFFTGITAVLEASLAGADIINMSYGARVPATLSWSVLGFDAYTAAIADSGVLLFAAAGNDGQNVDAEDCAGVDSAVEWLTGWDPGTGIEVCWEEAWWTPCENRGVICVGGLDWNDTTRAGQSNHGRSGGEVDIFAPFTVWVGLDPSSHVRAFGSANDAQPKSGTSFSSPYAAGVAALIWAAEPTRTADQVRGILYETAHPAASPVFRYVNAYDGVRRALGDAIPDNFPPEISILYPDDGQSFSRSTRIEFCADVWDFEDGFLTGNSIVWTSSLDGEIGRGECTSRLGAEMWSGTHTITATATDSGGASASDSVSIEIYPTPPVVGIDTPDDGDEFYESQDINLRGHSREYNSFAGVGGGSLPDDSVHWYIDDDDSAYASGHDAQIAGGTLSVGTHTITFKGIYSDPHPGGALALVLTGEDSITITIREDPDDLPPNVNIILPHNGSSWYTDGDDSRGPYKQVYLEGEATDDHDGPLTGTSLTWTTSIDGGPPETLGTGEILVVKLYAEGGCDGTTHEITLTATDSAGNPGTDSVTVGVLLLC